ncbi:hypothetical protein BC829DRAFT_87490 [Chytridium lagenaria]|nr:hypothetical protein BC829DRAFT_87490 [Chytridium lagenaria]
MISRKKKAFPQIMFQIIMMLAPPTLTGSQKESRKGKRKHKVKAGVSLPKHCEPINHYVGQKTSLNAWGSIQDDKMVNEMKKRIHVPSQLHSMNNFNVRE